MSTLDVIIGCALLISGITIIAAFAYMRGHSAGRDAQWMDDFFAGIAKDRARRAKNGQFKSTRKDA